MSTLINLSMRSLRLLFTEKIIALLEKILGDSLSLEESMQSSMIALLEPCLGLDHSSLVY
jgi:hypothetical protein